MSRFPFLPDVESLTDHEMKILQAKALRGSLTVCGGDILKAAIILHARSMKARKGAVNGNTPFPYGM